jgi:hypothetical protein
MKKSKDEPNPIDPIANAIGTYLRHRKQIAQVIRQNGIRRTATATGLPPMTVSRYCDGTGSNDARTHYVMARATRRHLVLVCIR